MATDPAPDVAKPASFDAFRVRGRSISRLEALSDAVFAFSATLLVVSLEVPSSFAELKANLEGFVAFGLTFVILVLIWNAHNLFFRRYGLDDALTVVINSVLLFLVLFYVYPLKFLATSLAAFFFGLGEVPRLSGPDDLRQLMVLYSLGFAAVFSCFVMLYRRAFRLAPKLGLSPIEQVDAAILARHYGLYVAVALLSAGLAAAGVGLGIGLPGWIYFLMGPLAYAHAVVSEKRRETAARALEERGGPRSLANRS